MLLSIGLVVGNLKLVLATLGVGRVCYYLGSVCKEEVIQEEQAQDQILQIPSFDSSKIHRLTGWLPLPMGRPIRNIQRSPEAQSVAAKNFLSPCFWVQKKDASSIPSLVCRVWLLLDSRRRLWPTVQRGPPLGASLQLHCNPTAELRAVQRSLAKYISKRGKRGRCKTLPKGQCDKFRPTTANI